ncbi:hypothetical protein BDN72DRAFT_859479 [Pluteus cervinus]|uniref:Uncharacterized protein n=1 Tax=Pluteus cervinus TaxID=181527 RepID=A0ACD3AN13_9AGAR|nr:hypothetical protein BDN72DRAFT_859479 [Pluteus cervinus]
MANLVASTCSGLALDDLEELDTSGSDMYLHWRFFPSTPFCWLQNLRKIIVRGRFSRSFIQYAETRTKEYDEAIQSSEPGKNLDLDLDLILENLNYSRDDGVIALGHLRDYLERRNALGFRLSKLEIITRDPLEEGLKVTFEHLVGTFVGMVRKELDGDIVT